MKAIIMAAGRGTRISTYINNVPKCTLNIEENCSLIENTIKKLNNKGIKDIAIILGYKSEYIKEILKKYHVKIYVNPFYALTNSIISLWFAREYLCDDDVILLNGDVFFEEEILNQICNTDKAPILFADNSRIEEADYKFYYENNILKKYGKELTTTECNAEYIGIARINKPFLEKFKKQLYILVEEEKFYMWWEDVLYSLVDECEIYVEDVKGKFWAEIDYFGDYTRILEFIKSSNNCDKQISV